MAYNISLLFIPFCILLIVATIMTKCRGAILALSIGMGVVLFHTLGSWITIIACVFIGFIGVMSQHHDISRRFEQANGVFGVGGSFRVRSLMFMKALRMISERPIGGWGLGTFRKEHQERLPAMATHRVHNDIIEITFETGIIGLALIVYFFSTLTWSDPFLSAALVAGIVSSCFFFTFREAHTAAPLMVICGLSLPPIGMVALPFFISLVLLLAMLNILWVHLGKKIIGLYWYGMGSKQKTREKARECVEKAVKWDSNTEYLSKHAFFQQHKDPGGCYDTVSRMIIHYDGRVVLWEIYDQMSKVALKLGAVNLSDYFNHKALALHPTFHKGVKFRETLDNLFNNMKEQQNGTVEVHQS